MTIITTGRATDFITFSRTSNATVVASDGKIKWAGHNLLTNSESFDASSWSKANVTSTDPVVSANAGVAPNGTTTADRIDFGAIDASGDYSIVSQVFTAPGAPLTASVWVKALAAGDVGKKIGIYLYDTGIVGVAFVTLTADWQQLTTSGTLIAGGSRSYVIGTLGSAFTGGVNQGAVSVLLWGAHLYRSDLGSMVLNPARGDAYYPTTPRNLLGYTEDFSNAYWLKSGLAATPVVSDTVVAPNGLQTADKIVEDTGASRHIIYAPASSGVVLGNKVTVSVYAKPAGRKYLAMAFHEGSPTYFIDASYFDIEAGTVTTTAAGITTAIHPAGNGWYRCSITQTLGGTPNNIVLSLSDRSGPTGTISFGSPIYTGDGVSGIYLWGAQLSDSASLDAYSPVYGAAVTSAAYYAPRLDFDANGSALGLLVEEQRTNLATYSEAFDDAVWAGATAGIASRTANTTAAPTGTSVADTITANNALAAHYIGRSVTWTAAVHTVSVFLKYSTQQFVQLSTWDGTTGRFANFDIQNGVAGTTSNATSTITSFGNGWYRCTMTGSAAQAAASGNWVICFANSNSASATPTYTTAGTDAFFVYGAQIEAGSFATSYIPTGAAQATRTEDVASVSTQAFPYSATEGTLVANFSWIGGSASNANAQTAVSLWQSSGNQVSIYNGDGVAAAYCVVGSSTQAYLPRSAVSAGVGNKVGFAFKANDFAAAQNGGAVATDTSGTLPSPASLAIGNSGSPSAYLNGYIRQITYIPRRLSNAELQARTV